jgi:filamentous hemagglutinin family protein
MTQSWGSWSWRLLAAVSLATVVSLYLPENYSVAQVTPDSTLGTQRSVVTPNVAINGRLSDRIDGGTIQGANLFHSFDEFSIGEGRGAYFINPAGIENIFSRVTGTNISNIQGTLGVLGNANIFLINPNGIIFGQNASLDIKGSFLASTANSINFADKTQFITNTSQPTALLSVSVPVGLQFGATSGKILNQSQANLGGTTNSSSFSDGLQVQPSKTLALVGGEVVLEAGNLTTVGGRIELGSVAGNSLVSLTQIEKGWALGYEGVQSFQDIHISQQAVVDVSGNGGGDIQVQGRRVMLTDASQISAITQGEKAGGDLTVNASESLELGSRTLLVTRTRGAGAAGNLTIITDKLSLQDGAQVLTSTSGKGSGGQLTVLASDSVELIGESDIIFSGLVSATAAEGDAGNLTINARRLLVRDGAGISTESTGRRVSRRFIPATGRGGDLTVNVSDSVEVSGKNSGLFASTQGAGDAGDLMIATGNLTVQDGAEVSVSSQGTGDAGSLEVTARSVHLENGGKLRATTESGRGGGNIKLSDLNLLLLRGKSEISTNARGEGNGGDINIDTNLLIGLGNSDITATAIKGRGGNIRINTQGIFGIEPRSQRTSQSDITASSQLGIDGMVEINRPDVDPTAELVVLPAEIVDVSGLVAQGCPAGGGNIATGSSQFVITGRGGLPPNPTEATRSDPVLADLGSPVQSQENRASADIPIKSTSSDSDTLVEAQGWVIGSKGEVVLTAAAVTPDIPWLTQNSCHGS